MKVNNSFNYLSLSSTRCASVTVLQLTALALAALGLRGQTLPRPLRVSCFVGAGLLELGALGTLLIPRQRRESVRATSDTLDGSQPVTSPREDSPEEAVETESQPTEEPSGPPLEPPQIPNESPRIQTLNLPSPTGCPSSAPKVRQQSPTACPSSAPVVKQEPPARVRLLAPCHQRGCYGPVDRQRATTVLHELHGNHPETIQFDPEALADADYGGTCSAMTLDYLDKVMEWLDGRNVDFFSEAEWIAHLEQATQECTSRPIAEYRHEQAALNCICSSQKSGTPNIDDPNIFAFHQDKAEALVRWKGLTINSASDVFDHRTDQLEAMGELLGKLGEGVHFIRGILPENSPKREEYGHSMAFIRIPSGDFFFDPNLGTVSLGRKETSTQALFTRLRQSFDRWGSPVVRFYQIG